MFGVCILFFPNVDAFRCGLWCSKRLGLRGHDRQTMRGCVVLWFFLFSEGAW